MVDRILRLTNPMMKGDDVLKLQQILSKKNYPLGAPDGIFGRLTETAVRKFQLDNLIESDGRVGPQTWNHLKNVETFSKNKEIPKIDFSLGKRKPENSEFDRLGEWNVRKHGNNVILSIKGKMSTFGGSNDKGVKKDEPLALFGDKDGDKASLEASKSMNLRGIFTAPNGMVGAARRLNEKALYIACRWRYDDIRKITGVNPIEYLKSIKVRLTNTRNGRRIEAVPVDWGPNKTTGRVADLSPGAAEALGLKTDQEVEVSLLLRKK